MFDFIISRKSQEKKCVFWWEPKDGSFNAGDHLSKIVVQQMLALKDLELTQKINVKNKL
ncbi:TPA: polysaccharide pyruvyl transferase family protein, partial [Klebsiella pneumoniae]|nr:polysaccharide pyruvyl transferase family protein [Klebsiella pneumoniae]